MLPCGTAGGRALRHTAWMVGLLWACAGTPEPLPEPAPALVVAPEPLPAPVPPPEGPVSLESLAVPTVEKLAGAQILVRFQGAVGAGEGARSRAEALERALVARRRALAGEDFGALARELSDSPEAVRGGRIGVFYVGTMIDEVERALASVELGAVGPLVETPWGFHVVRRDPIEEIHVRHLLVAHDQSWRATSTLSKAQAQARAEKAKAELEAGKAWDDVVRRYSDDTTRDSGGDLGTFGRGQMIPDFDAAAFALAPGQISGVVETPYGFHVIRRDP